VQADVDDIHEYLLLKGVEATSVHGGRAQEERETAIRQFKAGEKVCVLSLFGSCEWCMCRMCWLLPMSRRKVSTFQTFSTSSTTICRRALRITCIASVVLGVGELRVWCAVSLYSCVPCMCQW
jgi:hypothetical protein